MLPVPEKDAGFLRTLVETVLKELLRTVGNPVQRGHRFQRKADSNPVIADSR